MKLGDDFFANLFQRLNPSEVLTDLSPKDKGAYITLDCPICNGHGDAYIYKGSSTIVCNRKNKCGLSTPIIEYIYKNNPISKLDVIRYLSTITKTPMPEMDAEESLNYERIRTRENLLTEIHNYFFRLNLIYWLKHKNQYLFQIV